MNNEESMSDREYSKVNNTLDYNKTSKIDFIVDESDNIICVELEVEGDTNILRFDMNRSDMNDFIDIVNELLELKPLDLHKDFNEWEEINERLNKNAKRLIELKEIITSETDRIVAEAIEQKVNFKALYGANNADVRKKYAEEQISDLIEEKQELELSDKADKRRVDLLKRLIDMKIQLIKYTGGNQV